MAIIGTLPNNIQNGQLADAVPVMADFNFIVNQVNANATPIGTLTAPTGTTMAFQQGAAPLGWVAQTAASFQDAFLRCTTPSGFSNSGGSNIASGFFLSQFTTDGHALTVAELASHSHNDAGHAHAITDPGHAHTQSADTMYNRPGATAALGGSPNVFGGAASTATNTTGIGINTGFASIQANGGGAAHSHTFTANCKYVDQIIAVKS